MVVRIHRVKLEIRKSWHVHRGTCRTGGFQCLSQTTRVDKCTVLFTGDARPDFSVLRSHTGGTRGLNKKKPSVSKTQRLTRSSYRYRKRNELSFVCHPKRSVETGRSLRWIVSVTTLVHHLWCFPVSKDVYFKSSLFRIDQLKGSIICSCFFHLKKFWTDLKF